MASELDTPSVVSDETKEEHNSLQYISNSPKTTIQDAGKKILALEYAIEELKRSTASAGDIKDIKDSFSNLSDIKNKLREMEDLDLITRMETIKAEDDIHMLTESVESLKSKMDLLSGAIKIIGTKLGKDNKSASPEMRKEYLDAGKDIIALKSELENIRTNLDSKKNTDYSGKISALEQKYNEIDARIKTISSDTAYKAPSAVDSKEDIYALKKDLAALKEVVTRERTSLEPQISTINSLKEKSADIEKSLSEIKRKQQDTKSEKDIIALKTELDVISKNLDREKNPDYSYKISALEQKYKEIDSRLKTAASDKTDKTAGSKEDIYAIKKDLAALKEVIAHDKASLEPDISVLNSLKEKSADIEKSLAEMKKYQQDTEKSKEDYEKLQIDPKGIDSKTLANIKYIPLLKDNISKLYNVYNRTEKKIDDIEKAISHIDPEKITLPGVKADLDEKIEKAVETELAEVLENIDSLTSEIKSRIDDESVRQKTTIDALKQEHTSQISAIAGFDARLQRLEQARPYSYEDFADFKARVLADIEDLKKSARSISTKMSEHVENMVDNKIMPHVSNQNKIAETLSMLNRKVEEKHLEISKNTHEKVDRTTKQIMEKIAELENDVTLLKDMRVDIVEDMTLILERFEKDTGRPRSISDETEGKYDRKLDDLSREIDTLKTREMSGDESDIREIHALRELVHAVRNENDILKVELDKIKRFYIDMLKREEDAPVIIE